MKEYIGVITIIEHYDIEYWSYNDFTWFEYVIANIKSQNLGFHNSVKKYLIKSEYQKNKNKTIIQYM